MLRHILFPKSMKRTSLFSRDVVSIAVNPGHAMMDQRVAAGVTGLLAGQAVSIHCRVGVEGKHFESLGHYRADREGSLNLVTSQSLSGTYTGLNPMGLFVSLLPKPNQNRAIQLRTSDVTKPFVFNLDVYEDHLSLMDIENSTTKPLASTQTSRTYLSDQVRRVEVEEGDVRGTLFIPKAPGVYPGILDMFGSTGGIVEQRAALLASKGFACFALAFCAYKNLPKKHTDLKFSYFKDAVDFLTSQPMVPPDIGVLGTSFGGNIACNIAQYLPQIKAIVTMGAGLYCLTTDGTTLKVFDHPCYADNFKFVDGDTVELRFDLRQHWQQNTGIQLKESEANFLVLHGKDDLVCDVISSEEFVAEFRRIGRGHKCEHVFYESAGHLLNTPHVPFYSEIYHPMFKVYCLLGGDPDSHLKANEDSWERLQLFFKKHLNPDNPDSVEKWPGHA